MIILTTKYCYVIIDIAPKGRLHLLIVARNGVGPTVDALGPEHLPLVKDIKRIVNWLKRKYSLPEHELTIGFHPPRHTSQGAIHCHFVWKVRRDAARKAFAKRRMISVDSVINFLEMQKLNEAGGADEMTMVLYHATQNVPWRKNSIIADKVWKSEGDRGTTHGKGAYFALRTGCAVHKSGGKRLMCAAAAPPPPVRCEAASERALGGAPQLRGEGAPRQVPVDPRRHVGLPRLERDHAQEHGLRQPVRAVPGRRELAGVRAHEQRPPERAEAAPRRRRRRRRRRLLLGEPLSL